MECLCSHISSCSSFFTAFFKELRVLFMSLTEMWLFSQATGDLPIIGLFAKNPSTLSYFLLRHNRNIWRINYTNTCSLQKNEMQPCTVFIRFRESWESGTVRELGRCMISLLLRQTLQGWNCWHIIIEMQFVSDRSCGSPGARDAGGWSLKFSLTEGCPCRLRARPQPVQQRWEYHWSPGVEVGGFVLSLPDREGLPEVPEDCERDCGLSSEV